MLDWKYIELIDGHDSTITPKSDEWTKEKIFDSKAKVSITSLPPSWDNHILYDKLKKYGTIVKCKVDKHINAATVLDKVTTWVSKWKGECIFDSVKDAEKCVKDKVYLSSIAIEVELKDGWTTFSADHKTL